MSKEILKSLSFKLVDLDSENEYYNEVALEAAYQDYCDFWYNNGFVNTKEHNVDDFFTEELCLL